MKSLDTPILFLIFNRADTTARVFEEIRKARPGKLFIAADGPRPHVPEDAEKCRLTRAVVHNVDWPCEVKTLFRDKNIGCKKAVGSAISWFFSIVEQGIILEDDCLPNQSFFLFCSELLERYRNDETIMMISGSNLAGTWPTTASYFYSKYANIWGWATWRRAWAYYDGDMASWKDIHNRENIRRRIGSRSQWNIKKWAYDQVSAGRKDSWAYAWDFAVLVRNGLSIVPSVNLVENIGFGKGATHTGARTEHLARSRQISPTPLVYNDKSIAYSAYDAYFMKKVFGNTATLMAPFKFLARRVILGGALITRKFRMILATIKGIHIIRPDHRLPNYYLVNGHCRDLNIVVDVGCGFDADLSMYMAKHFGIKAVGIDPTLKHQGALAELSKKSNGKFTHKLWALSSSEGKISFNESETSVSGSIFEDHRNIAKDTVRKYYVESVSLAKLPSRLALPRIDYVKIDIEGAEYDLLAKATKEDLDNYGQIFVEFHHHAVPRFAKKDTLDRVARLESFGFTAFSIDKRDYLFYRS